MEEHDSFETQWNKNLIRKSGWNENFNFLSLKYFVCRPKTIYWNFKRFNCWFRRFRDKFRDSDWKIQKGNKWEGRLVIEDGIIKVRQDIHNKLHPNKIISKFKNNDIKIQTNKFEYEHSKFITHCRLLKLVMLKPTPPSFL